MRGADGAGATGVELPDRQPGSGSGGSAGSGAGPGALARDGSLAGPALPGPALSGPGPGTDPGLGTGTGTGRGAGSGGTGAGGLRGLGRRFRPLLAGFPGARRAWIDEVTPGPDEDPYSASRWRGGWFFASVWLIYLLGPLGKAWHEPVLWRRLVGVTAILVFSLLYVWSWGSLRGLRIRGLPISLRRRLLIVGGGFGLTVLGALGAGESALAMSVFVTVLAMFALPTTWAILTVLGLVGLVEGVSRVVPGWTQHDQMGLQIVVAAVAMWGVSQVGLRNRQLALAHQQLATLAVAEERARFARDLHDVLGHSLTVLTVKAELAGRLVRLDPERAEREIGEVEQLARDALSDVRVAVAGYREANLVSELISARAALDAAGIEAHLPQSVEEVPAERRVLFGWVVREAVTNVLRHSGARRCWVRVSPDGVEIIDDGSGTAESVAAAVGHGLSGLRERAAAAGAVLSITGAPGGGLAVRVGW